MFGKNVFSSGRRQSIDVKDWAEYLVESKRIFESQYGNEPVECNYSMDDFDFIQTLAFGVYSRVVLCRLKLDHKYYVLKIIKKSLIVQRRAVGCMFSHKKILHAITPIGFHLITSLKCSFKDNCYLYFCEPFLNGGDLNSHLKTLKKLEERVLTYLAAQAVLALEFVHSLGCVFRDVKSENFVLDDRGYLKLINFGFCKRLKGRAYTVCGSPEYIAPEMLFHKGYGKSVDWWSLGVLVYELACGRTPFQAPSRLEMLQMMEAGEYDIPGHCSDSLRSLLRGLVQADISKRYGCLKDGVEDLKSHVWFKGLDWLALVNRQITLPFRPKVSGPGDVIHYGKFVEHPLETSVINQYEELFRDF